jgi:hypothetical protein
MENALGYIKTIRKWNEYIVYLLIGVVLMFSISLITMALGNTTDKWIYGLSGATIVAFAVVIPVCYLRWVAYLALDKNYTNTHDDALKILEQREKSVEDALDKPEQTKELSDKKEGAPIKQ